MSVFTTEGYMLKITVKGLFVDKTTIDVNETIKNKDGLL